MTMEELYSELHGELFAWCCTVCGSSTLAEELIQEGFLKALINSDVVLSLNKHQQRSWLYKTIKNLYLNSLRRRSHEADTDSAPEPSYIPHEYGMVDTEQIINMLPDNERLLFIMRYFQGYTSSELGRIFKLSPGTVRSRLFSARSRLKQILRSERRTL